jgi:hypothetical protein
MNPLSSSISSSHSTSSSGDLLSALIALRASFGRLKLVLLLEAALPEQADMAVPGRLRLEIEVRRDDAPDVSAPVVEIDIVGDAERGPPNDVADNSNSRAGISNQTVLQ